MDCKTDDTRSTDSRIYSPHPRTGQTRTHPSPCGNRQVRPAPIMRGVLP
jgi:hypothetical protein